MPTTTIPCPRCDRPLKVPEAAMGKRVRCPDCGEVTRARRPEPASPYDAPDAGIGPARPEAGATWRFQVKFKQGPAGLRKGTVQAEVTPGALVLHRGKAEIARIKAGAGARHEGGNLVATTVNGDTVTIAISPLTMFQDRLAEDVARFLDGRLGRLESRDYKVPNYLSAVAFSPAVVGVAGMSGGAIGGGIGGGIAGALIMANFSIVRREHWPVAARIAACLGLTTVGIVLFFVLFTAAVSGVRGLIDPKPQPQPQPPVFGQFNPGQAPAPGLPAGGEAPPEPAIPEPKTPPSATDFEGLVGYWPLDDGAGTKADDASGRGHHGSLTNHQWVEGVRGGATRFDGEGFLDFGESTDFNFARGQSFTFAGWFRSPEGEGSLVSQRSRADGAPVIDIVLEGGNLTAVAREDGNETPAFAKLAARVPKDDRWHHFALVRHADRDVELYVDGRSARKIAGMGTGGAITTDLRAIGSERKWVATGWAAPHYLKGAVDEVCVFARDLEAAEIGKLAGRP